MNGEPTVDRRGRRDEAADGMLCSTPAARRGKLTEGTASVSLQL